MFLSLIKICAVVTVSLVAVGAHTKSPEVIKSAHVLQFDRGTKYMRTNRLTQDDEEERGVLLLLSSFET